MADAGSCDVSIIDMRTGKLVARVRTGKKFPVDELVDTVTGKVFVNNQFSGTVTMFDAATTRMDPPGC
jgi:DNA-binding beta-propeller fold protein YncE